MRLLHFFSGARTIRGRRARFSLLMIAYDTYHLANGLTLLVMEQPTTPLVAINTLYDVGARDEEAGRTGFAHLFEHLMFGGTKAVPDYDRVVSEMCGESNAATNNDFTHYYLTVPCGQLEAALRLEADRMRLLDFSQRSLSVQQSVVTEEYHYRYVNQPYGDVWMLLRPLCYKVHPYRWCTIGADIRHVQEASVADVEHFFFKHYRPRHATMAVAGNVRSQEVSRLVEQLFGDIEAGEPYERCLPPEPMQQEARTLHVRRSVPADALYMAYPTCGRTEADFAATDLVSDILSNGRSSRLYTELVMQRQFFTELDAYVTGDRDPGLFVVAGKVAEGVALETARRAVEQQLARLADEQVAEAELQKVVNKFEATFGYGQLKALDCAMSLCYYQWLGHPEWVNTEPELYRQVTAADVRRVAEAMFAPCRQSVLYYERETNA